MNRVILLAMLIPGALHAQQDATTTQQDTTMTLTLGGFVDAYYANQFGRDGAGDIVAFLTQPSRNREFNVNLAFIEAKLSGGRVRGRLALQAGTSVQSNYAAEPRIGAISGPELSRHIQEAVVGYQVLPTLWIDGGIYLSHIGSESWASRDNWTYTRSVNAEYQPYYETGVKATWTPSSRIAASVHVLNGWQNISETNDDKAVGARIDFTPTPRVTLSYANFIGNERADSLAGETRVFHDAIVKVQVTDAIGIMATGDYGTQGDNAWYGFSIIGRLQPSSRIALAGRFERYSDPDQVLIATGTGPGFVANGFSVGIDLAPAPRFLWRTELRSLMGDDAVFPRPSGNLSDNGTFIVSSLALTF